MPTDRFEDALQKITYDFAMQVVELIRTTTLDELGGLAQPPEPETTEPEPSAPAKPVKRRGRPPKAKTEATPAEAPEMPVKRRGRPPKKAAASAPVEAVESASAEPAPPAKKAKKRRNWPKCSVEGCGKNFYAPSGTPRLCYAHHIEAGGKQSPLLAAREKKAAAATTEAPKAAKATKSPRTVKPKAHETPEATEPPEAKPKKKRPWPTCSIEGCEKNVYMPSGAKKMCYQHNLEHGGAPTPLAKVNKARKTAGKKTKAPATPKAVKAEKKPKTIRRKKADKAKK